MPEPDNNDTADFEVANSVISDGFSELDPVDVQGCAGDLISSLTTRHEDLADQGVDAEMPPFVAAYIDRRRS